MRNPAIEEPEMRYALCGGRNFCHAISDFTADSKARETEASLSDADTYALVSRYYARTTSDRARFRLSVVRAWSCTLESVRTLTSSEPTVFKTPPKSQFAKPEDGSDLPVNTSLVFVCDSSTYSWSALRQLLQILGMPLTTKLQSGTILGRVAIRNLCTHSSAIGHLHLIVLECDIIRIGYREMTSGLHYSNQE
ncbi:unnamed protein product [Microthlaspi erraticum]|uniref:Uncharacterized protein n=1 Tax=Microthlaspi erraticum TaxID=1685480 RepID=A0A6D2JGQ0_9BRAS|nr:unnamed protein product [Microthlaspi erraticum]CAA7037271.1 unnamed protein product [Microthlaspi erraticum]CAA7038984.1 unnamed protein product [Microthlaspi erraticum]